MAFRGVTCQAIEAILRAERPGLNVARLFDESGDASVRVTIPTPWRC